MDRTRTTLLVALALALAAFGLPLAAAQSQPSQAKPKPQVVQQQEEDPGYTEEEYEAYDKAAKEPDSDKKGAALIAFLEKYPKQKVLQPYIVTEYKTLLFNHYKAHNWAKLAPAAEAWLKYEPNDLATIGFIVDAAQKVGDDKKFIEYGQKLYGAKPIANLAYYLAQSHKKLGDNAKYEEWILKALAYPEFASDLAIRMEFVDKYTKEKDFKKAADWAREALKVFDTAKKPEATPEADWRDYKSKVKRGSHYIIGIQLFDADKYDASIAEMKSALKTDPHFGMSYFYIGLAQWKLGKIENDEAPLSFAKTYLLKCEAADKAKEYMEKIYKSLHNETLHGIEKVINQAKEELATQRTAANK